MLYGNTSITREPEASMHQPVRVLVADDHKVMRQGLVDLLGDYPSIQVVGEAATGTQAIELARLHQPHAILMDITMPGCTGIEATQAIHAEFPAIRIVGLSMLEDKWAKNAMLAAGASEFLSKGNPGDSIIQALIGTSE